MELWNDFEGKTLDGQFRLERLIGPKGRSAFFEARNVRDEAITVRLIESLNDEDEILTRWNAVRGLKSAHLLTILDAKKTVLDGVHLVYAVLERTQAELGDILRERPLTTEEARQVAVSVLGGLEDLHGRGLVHEHVEPGSVLACGEEVKLRSDCVREAPEGTEGETLRRRDTHDAAMLIGQALTQRRDLGQTRLPRPFDDLVRNGMTGTWGLKEMSALVRPVVPVAAPAAPAAVIAAGRVATPTATSAAVPVAAAGPVLAAASATVAAAAGARGGYAAGAMSTEARGTGTAGTRSAAPGAVKRPTIVSNEERGGRAASPAEAAGSTSAAAVAAALGAGPGVRAGEPVAPMRRASANDPIVGTTQPSGRRWGVWAAVAAAVVLVIGLLVHFLGGGSKPAAAAGGSATIPPSMPAPESAPAPVVAKPSAGANGGRTSHAAASLKAAQTVPQVGSATETQDRAPVGSKWRVLAFTYRREDQAQHKATAIAQQHPELRPQVFTPTGGSPYLVSLGGWMTYDEASALREKARSEGMPRDLYAQNYRGH